MELVIPGLILVALMIWASTRIKKNAAAAFDTEAIETDDFSLRKPEGFLHILNDDSGLPFRAYTKEFGTVGRGDVRQATAEVQIFDDENFDTRRNSIIEDSESVVSEDLYIDGGEKALIIESILIKDGGEYHAFFKLVTRSAKVLELRVLVLSEHKDANLSKIEEMLDGFRPK